MLIFTPRPPRIFRIPIYAPSSRACISFHLFGSRLLGASLSPAWGELLTRLTLHPHPLPLPKPPWRRIILQPPNMASPADDIGVPGDKVEKKVPAPPKLAEVKTAPVEEIDNLDDVPDPDEDDLDDLDGEHASHPPDRHF
jgi:hypothetical protein